MSVQCVTILGATGSIGRSTLDVISRNTAGFELFALTAGSGWERLAELCATYQPAYAVIADEAHRFSLQERLVQLGLKTQALSGLEGLNFVASAPEVTTVVAAIVGAAGLLPTLSAAKSGKRVLLANKEALVMSGELFIDTVRANQALLLPIDSEHNAIFQCLPATVQANTVAGGLSEQGVRRVLLTASGGPFLSWDAERLETVTPEQACRHPKWDMGRKISVDSATLMNKGLELIEACYLFDLPVERVDVHIHPQAIVHSMVEYRDGSILAQLGSPDMRTPIANALGWPERLEAGVEPLNLFDMAALQFEAPDRSRFPCLRLAADAFQAGGLATTVLNAANEEAVAAFLRGQLRFTQIAALVEDALESQAYGQMESLEQVVSVDQEIRAWARNWLAKQG